MPEIPTPNLQKNQTKIYLKNYKKINKNLPKNSTPNLQKIPTKNYLQKYKKIRKKKPRSPQTVPQKAAQKPSQNFKLGPTLTNVSRFGQLLHFDLDKLFHMRLGRFSRRAFLGGQIFVYFFCIFLRFFLLIFFVFFGAFFCVIFL